MIYNSDMNSLLRYISLFLFIFWLLAFVISVIKDRRRFRNGIYFLFLWLSSVYFVIMNYSETTFGRVFIAMTLILIVLVVLVVPILLIFDGFFMIKREGFRLSNLLSLLFGIVVFIGEYSLFNALFAYDNPPLLQRTILFAVGYAVFFFSFLMLSFITYSLIMGILPKKVDYDYVICLGAGLIEGERVSKLLANRLDKAKKVYERSMTSCKIIASGGQGGDEKISEALAMKNYLVEQGVPENDIILEDQSKNTWENLENSQAIIQKRKGRQWVAVVTSNYHVLRTSIYSKMLSFPITGIGARTALYYWPSAIIREYVALLKEYLFINLAVFLCTGGLIYLLILKGYQ